MSASPLFQRLSGPEHAPVVVLSNSLASTHAMWAHQVPALHAAGYRVLEYDTRGHGASGLPAAPWHIADLAADVLRLLDQHHLERVHFCGLSLGGMTGQWLGAHHGDRLHTLALCATTAWAGGPATWEERIALVRAGGMQAVAEATLARWFSESFIASKAPVLDLVRRDILATPVEGYARCGTAIAEMDQRESLRHIAVPTLVMVGADDPGTPVSASEFLQQHIPDATLVVVPDTKHLFNLEAPAAFNAALLGFLARHGAR